jgi:hypothetical protein
VAKVVQPLAPMRHLKLSLSKIRARILRHRVVLPPTHALLTVTTLL